MKVSNLKLTRRQLVIAAAAGSAALKASAQAEPQTAAPAATDKVRQNAETLAKFAIPISTEPAFQFKA